jgi:general secretion pathway protein A
VERPPAKGSFADEPDFLASLSNLDRGLVSGDRLADPATPVPPRPAVHPAPSARPRRDPLRPEDAFSLSTDPRFLFNSAAHAAAAEQLLAAIGRRDGLVVLTGEFGAGKTLLCRTIAEQADRRLLVAMALDGVSSIERLLQTMLVEFGAASLTDFVRVPVATRQSMTATLCAFLASIDSLEATAVVVIDEAHHLPIEVLEGLPAISHAAGESARPLQIVLVGQPELTDILERSELRLVSEEVGNRTRLGLLRADEIGGYVAHRAGMALGVSNAVFGEHALARIQEISGGLPRTVNLLCARALSRDEPGQGSTTPSTIDAAAIDAAATELELVAPAAPARRDRRMATITILLLALLAAGAASALWMYQDEVARAVVEWEQVPPAPSAPKHDVPDPPAPIELPAPPPPPDTAR